MAAVQAPSLPYVRDEASTSQLLSSYHAHQQAAQGQFYNNVQAAYVGGAGAPMYDNYALTSNGTDDLDDMYDEEAIDDQPDEEMGAGDGSALQYWAAKRHMTTKKADKAEEEYGRCYSLVPSTTILPVEAPTPGSAPGRTGEL